MRSMPTSTVPVSSSRPWKPPRPSAAILSFPDSFSTSPRSANDSWGHGYATEARQAMVELARSVGVRRLYALCHTEHRASWRVLEKCGFVREGILHSHSEFPNLTPREICDVLCYAKLLP